MEGKKAQIEERRAAFEEGDEINLLDYLIVLLKRKWLIIGITLGAIITAVIISLTTPPTYTAEAKILPPTSGGGGAAAQLMAQLGGLGGLIGGAAATGPTSGFYMGLLKSRPVLDPIVERFSLIDVYMTETNEETRNALAGALKAATDRESGIITITVEDRDPERAAEMANAFVEELINLNNRLAVTEASQRRFFLEEQLKLSKEDLIESEESLRRFQEKTGAIRIDAQAEAVLEGIAQLRAQIAAKEVQLRVMRTYATPHNPDLQRLEEELRGLREQLGFLETKEGDYNPGHLMTAERIPAIGTEYIRQIRNFKYNEALYEILMKQFEAAKIDEARDAAIIQVIEEAIPPEKRTGPKRKQMVMIAAITGLFFSVFVAFIVEYKENASNNPENRERMEKLKRYIRLK